MKIMRGKDLVEALEAARCGARILRKAISNMERTLLSIDTLLAAAEKEQDETKARRLAEMAAIQSYREQEKLATAFFNGLQSLEEDGEE